MLPCFSFWFFCYCVLLCRFDMKEMGFKRHWIRTKSEIYSFFFEWQYQTESKRVIWFVVYFCEKCFALVCVVYIYFTRSESQECAWKRNDKKKLSFLSFVHLPTRSLIHRRRAATMGCALYVSLGKQISVFQVICWCWYWCYVERCYSAALTRSSIPRSTVQSHF